MKKGALLVYLIIMLSVLLAYMLLDLNVLKSESGASDSMKMAMITMLQAECAVNMQTLEEDTSAIAVNIRVEGLKKFAIYAEKHLKFGEGSGKTWKALKERAEISGLLTAQDDTVKLNKLNISGVDAIEKDVKEFMNRAVENGFDFNF